MTSASTRPPRSNARRLSRKNEASAPVCLWRVAISLRSHRDVPGPCDLKFADLPGVPAGTLSARHLSLGFMVKIPVRGPRTGRVRGQHAPMTNEPVSGALDRWAGPELFLVSPDIPVWRRWLARWSKDRTFIL